MDELSEYFLSLQGTSRFRAISARKMDPTLVLLDLDGTLIGEPLDHRSSPSPYPFRPGLIGFLTLVQKLGYTLAIWSAAASSHVDEIHSQLKKLSSQLVFRFVWNGSKCDIADLVQASKKRKGFSVLKPLSKVWREFPEYHSLNTFILDNTPHTYSLNPLNAIPIPTFNPAMNSNDHGFQKILLYFLLHHPLSVLLKEKGN